MPINLPPNSITTHSGVANDAMANTSAAKHKNPPTITNLSMLYLSDRHEYITVFAVSFFIVDRLRNMTRVE